VRVPFAGTFHSPLPQRNYLPYGRELLDQGLEAAAVIAFERAADANPGASTLYRLGTLLAETGRRPARRAAFERALVLEPGLAEANNDLGALLAQGGDLDAAMSRFRAALASTPDYPDALNNLGYALLLTGQTRKRGRSTRRPSRSSPTFPKRSTISACSSGAAATWIGRERYFREALRRRPTTARRRTTWRWCWSRNSRRTRPSPCSRTRCGGRPRMRPAYVTLAKIYASVGPTAGGDATLERLLQRKPGACRRAGVAATVEKGRCTRFHLTFQRNRSS
jgi:tetratricopeptide (TPR) repeat protein